MLLTLTTTHRPATDLGFLLGKNPARSQSFDVGHGRAHVFYPEAGPERCTVALLLDLDPVGLVRGGAAGEGGLLDQYVNDRPYAASSFLSAAIARVFGSGLKGTCKERPELATAAIPLETRIPVLPCRGGHDLLQRLFGPLGHQVGARRLPLDPGIPDWGDSPYHDVRLASTCRLSDLLSHLYVLLPVLDNDKHYWVGQEEVEKLLAHGKEWLASHPERELITNRYLRRRRRLVREALERLAAEDEADPETAEEAGEREEAAVEARLGLNDLRLAAVVAVLKKTGARSVLDLGCGEGRLLDLLRKDASCERLAGMDVSIRSLEIASRRLGLDHPLPGRTGHIELFQGALTYRDSRLSGFDAACAVEVIEHLDRSRLEAFCRVVFEAARPATVVVTTPNAEYNARIPNLPAGRLRHRDHRFEWTRQEFREWCQAAASRFGYTMEIRGVGEEDSALGPATQMGVFSL